MECDGGLGEDVLVSYETPIFQGVLMSYLDDKAPVIGETESRRCRTSFGLALFILLFPPFFASEIQRESRSG